MTTDEQMGQALIRLRGPMTQTDLAARFRELGYPWHQPTIARIEAGERPLRLTEAIDLANLFGVGLDAFASENAGDAYWAGYAAALRDLSRRLAAEADGHLLR